MVTEGTILTERTVGQALEHIYDLFVCALPFSYPRKLNMVPSMLAWTTISQFSSNSRRLVSCLNYQKPLRRYQAISSVCISRILLSWCEGASLADEKEEKMPFFFKLNISRCVNAFRQVMMFSRSVKFLDFISGIRFDFEHEL